MAGSIKIPVSRSPQTSVTAPTATYQRGAQPIDYSSISKTLRLASDELTARKKQQTAFALRNKVLEETNFMQSDFARRTQEEPLGADNFTPRYLTAMEERHKQLVEEQYAAGVDPEDLDDFSTRLGSLRTSYGERALGFQETSQTGLAQKEGDRLATNASQYASAQPLENYSSAVQEVTDFWERYPGITAPVREAKLAQALDAIRGGTRKSVSMMFPEVVLEKLDPQNLTAPPTTQRTGAAGFALPEGLDADRTTVGQELLRGGLPAAVVAGFLGNFDVEGGYGGAAGDNGTASGIAQWRKERRTAFKVMFHKEPHEATKVEQAQFVVHEMNNPEAAGMTVAERDAILAAPDAATAAELIDKYYERSAGLHTARRKEAALKYVGAPAVTETTTPAERKPYDPTTIRTGIPLFDDMTGEERLQAVAMARERMAQREVSQKAAVDVAHQNAVTAYSTTGEYAGQLVTKEQYIAAFGPVAGEQRFAEVVAAKDAGEFVTASRTMSMEQVRTKLAALAPNSSSPTFAVEQQRYAQMQRAVAQMAEERRKDPAAYILQAFPDIAQNAATANDPASRRAVYAQMKRAQEQLGIPPMQRNYLTLEATQAMQQQYLSAPPAQRLGMLNQLISEMGGTNAGLSLGRGGNSEILGDLAINQLMAGQPGYQNKMLEIFAGREKMSQDPAQKPAPAEINRAFAGRLQSAIRPLNPSFSRVMNEAAVAIYVSRGGRTGRASSRQGADGFDSELYAAAVREVFGGSAEDKDTGIVYLGGGRAQTPTILPPGITGTQLQNWWERVTNSDFARLSGGKQPRDKFGNIIPLYSIQDDGVLVLVAPGIYQVQLKSDGGWVAGGPGKPFELRINPSDVRGH